MPSNLADCLHDQNQRLVRVEIEPPSDSAKRPWWNRLLEKFRSIADPDGEVQDDLASVRCSAVRGGTAWLRRNAVRNASMEAEIVRELAMSREQTAGQEWVPAQATLIRAEADKHSAKAQQAEAEATAQRTEVVVRTIQALRESGFDAFPVVELDGTIGLLIRDARAADNQGLSAALVNPVGGTRGVRSSMDASPTEAISPPAARRSGPSGTE